MLLRLLSLLIAIFSLAAEADPTSPVNPQPPPRPVRYETYYVRGYPRYANWSCDATAQAIGAKLVEVARKQGYPETTLWRTICDRVTQDTYDMRIIYRSSARLPLVSTDHIDTSDSTGLYKSREECETDLRYGLSRAQGGVSQLEYFKRATGTEPVVAYCTSTAYFGWTYPWSLRIESFGNAIRNSYRFDRMIGFVNPVGGDEATIAEILKNAAAQHIYINRIVIGQDSAWIRKLHFSYYAAEPTGFALSQRLYYDSFQTCYNQVEDVRRGFAASGVAVLGVFCAGESFPTMNILRQAAPDFEMVSAGESYGSLQSCWADRARVMKEHHDTLKWDVRYALCYGTSPDYRMYLMRHLLPNQEPTQSPGMRILNP